MADNPGNPSIIPQPIRDVVNTPLAPQGVRDFAGHLTIGKGAFGGRAHFVPVDDEPAPDGEAPDETCGRIGRESGARSRRA